MNIRENPLKVLGPYGDESDVQAIREVIESGWWGKGPKVQEFEEEFESYTNDRIDIGEVSVQEFGLRLDPYPSSVSASYKGVEFYMRPNTEYVGHPFSALVDLKAKKKNENLL